MSYHVSFERLLWLGCGDLAAQFQYLLNNYSEFTPLQNIKKIGVRRRPEKVPNGFLPWAGNLTDVDTWRSLLEKSDKDIWVISLTPRQRTEAGYHDGYCLPLQQLGKAMEVSPNRPKRVIFISSTSVYAQNSGEKVDECSVTQPSHFNGQQLVCAENILQGLPWGKAVQVSTVRLAGIYGQGRSRLLKKILNANNLDDLGSLNHLTNRIHSLDAAKIIAHLMMRDEIKPIYIGCDTKPSLQGDVFLWLATRMSEQLPAFDNLKQLALDLQEKEWTERADQGKQCQPRALQKENFEWLHSHYQSGYAPLVKEFCESVLTNGSTLAL